MTLRTYIFSIVMAVSLSGCYYDAPAPKLPHVTESTVSHPVIFTAAGAGINPQEKSSLAAFVQTMSAGAVSYAGLTADDSNPLAVRRAYAVRDVLIRSGVSKTAIHLEPTLGMDAQVIGVTLRYAQVVPPKPCPDWSKDSSMNYGSNDSSNFGCAYYNNLVVQLADPADYNRGHGAPAISAARDGAYVGAYMSGSSSSSASATSSSSSSGSAGGSTSTVTSTP